VPCIHHQFACGASYNMRTEAHLHVPMLLHCRFSFVFYTLKVANAVYSVVAIPLKTARIKEYENAPVELHIKLYESIRVLEYPTIEGFGHKGAACQVPHLALGGDFVCTSKQHQIYGIHHLTKRKHVRHDRRGCANQGKGRQL